MPEDEEAYSQFMTLYDIAEKRGLPWYDVSNFAKKGFKSRHNSSYWTGAHYLGFGPAAHSYDGRTRCWNIPDLNAYIENPCGIFEEEVLNPKDMINDYLITRLITRDGINLKIMKKQFNTFNINVLKEKMEKYISAQKARRCGDNICLTEEGLFVSDAILKDIIYIS